MNFLVFQLHAPLAAWGEPAVGEFRPSANEPSESALQGLLGAALGVDRNDGDAHCALAQGYGYAVGTLARRNAWGEHRSSSLLRDYHTAQTVSANKFKKAPHRTRRDELAFAKSDLNTILSTREYRQDGAWLVAVWAQQPDARWSLAELQSHLQRPVFTLYLGRKCCPPSAPLVPKMIEAGNATEALQTYWAEQQVHLAKHRETLKQKKAWDLFSASENLLPDSRLERVCSQDAAQLPTQPAQAFRVSRKDRVLSRSHWQFGDRTQHVALLAEEG